MYSFFNNTLTLMFKFLMTLQFQQFILYSLSVATHNKIEMLAVS